jgi:hypothetical protein
MDRAGRFGAVANDVVLPGEDVLKAAGYDESAILGRITMTYTADSRVDTYIDGLPEWQQTICREVRELVHAADREVTETIKRTNRPYFVLQGNICGLLATKGHVNVFLYDGAIVPDPERIITAGHDNKTARTWPSAEVNLTSAATRVSNGIVSSVSNARITVRRWCWLSGAGLTVLRCGIFTLISSLFVIAQRRNT